MGPLQQLLDALAAGDTEAVTALLASADLDLAALDTEALAAFETLRSAESHTDDEVAQLESLAAAVESIRAEQTARTEAAEAQAARIADLTSRVTPPADPAAGDPAADPAGDPASSADPAVDPAGDPAPASDPAPALVAGQRARVDLAAIARRTPRPTPPAPNTPTLQTRRASLVAAAGVTGYSAGQAIGDLDELAQIALARFGGFPRSDAPVRKGRGSRMQASIARVQREIAEELTADALDAQEVLDRAGDERRLPGGSLVAAGGWCAPSETLYDMQALETATGLLQIPEIAATRGGIRSTLGVDFSTIWAGVGFHQTEAQAIAGTAKTAYNVPCANFTETRLGVQGVYITAGILQNRAYPELVKRVVGGAMIAHEHKINALTLADMATGSTAVTIAAGIGAASQILNALALQAMDMRYKLRLDPTSTVEVVGPDWVIGEIIADLTLRQPFEDTGVVRAQINTWLAQRGISVQWVYDWQDAFSGVSAGPGAATALATWPTSVKFLMYPAGVWVRATDAVINLEAVYDSAAFSVNQYTALFTEEGIATIMRSPGESRVITMPIAPTGTVGARVVLP